MGSTGLLYVGVYVPWISFCMFFTMELIVIALFDKNPLQQKGRKSPICQNIIERANSKEITFVTCSGTKNDRCHSDC